MPFLPDVLPIPRFRPPSSEQPLLPRAEAAQPIPASVHLLLWGLMLLCNTLFWGVAMRRQSWSWPLAAADVALTCGAYAALFYGNWYVIIPRYLSRTSLTRFLGVLLLALSLTFAVRIASCTVLNVRTRPLSEKIVRQVATMTPSGRVGFMLGVNMNDAGGGVAITSLLVLLLSFYLRLTADYQHEQTRRQQENQRREALEKQHLAAELSLLKAQINPHFLFNTLNNIYSLTSEESAEAPAAVAVLQLAELMRYQLYESAADHVPLEKEISHIQSFLSLQRLRLPSAAAGCLRFDIQAPEAARFPVAPMLLLPLVENAFKHGDLRARPHAVDLRLTLAADRLTFAVRNDVRRTAETSPGKPGGGVGLVNLRRRLQLLYPDRHHLHVAEANGHYHITLTLEAASAYAAPTQSGHTASHRAFLPG
ncbi:sensor histidine kinase [Hymenobacter rigui]|uniref:Signal transduction histidine kinase internal region domain-containing protein n=1 Tax=Hymenobacter rigui TaxID=334424 RepID=A0A428KMB3_9BACT|nr:histidine kinase [Hymenobacter rigui]RSK47499.1 hypothetical protein EI291_14670 [Hymenobacter rigui]